MNELSDLISTDRKVWLSSDNKEGVLRELVYEGKALDKVLQADFFSNIESKPLL